MKRLIPLVFALLTPFGAAIGETDGDIEAIGRIISATERGWEAADGTPFRAHFLDVPGTRYFESGGQNVGLDDLVHDHVEPEGDALAGLDLTFSEPEVHIEGDVAWAVFDTEIRATVRESGRVIHNRGHATYIFRRVDSEWKVVHTHSSSRPVASPSPSEEDHDHGAEERH